MAFTAPQTDLGFTAPSDEIIKPASSALLPPIDRPMDDSQRLNLIREYKQEGADAANENANAPSVLAQTFADPNKVIATSSKPFVPIPKFTINPDDSKTMAVGKEAVNLLAGIPEFIESPLGLATLPIAAEARGGKILAGLFGADAVDNAGKQIIQTHADWDNYTPAQKAAAVTDIAGTIGLAGLLGHTALKSDVKIPSEAVPDAIQPPTPTSEQPQPSPDPNIKEVPPETSAPSGGTPLVPTVAAESPVTPKAVDSMPPAQQAALQHGDGIRYGLTLGADDVAELQKKYDETTKQQIAAFQSGDGAAAKAAFGRANFYGGALMGATRGEHKISGSNYDQFLKDNPDLKPSPETAKAAPVAETLPTTTKPVGEQASGGGAESPTVAKSATVQTPPVATGQSGFVPPPLPEKFNSLDDALKYREAYKNAEIEFYKSLGLNDSEAQKFFRAGDNRSNTDVSKLEEKLSPENQERLDLFSRGEGQPVYQWDRQYDPSSLAGETDKKTLAENVVQNISRESAPNELGDKMIHAAVSLRQLKENGGTWSDVARALDSHTTRISGSQGDKAFVFKKYGQQIRDFADQQGIDLPQGELGKKVGESKQQKQIQHTNPPTPPVATGQTLENEAKVDLLDIKKERGKWRATWGDKTPASGVFFHEVKSSEFPTLESAKAEFARQIELSKQARAKMIANQQAAYDSMKVLASSKDKGLDRPELLNPKKDSLAVKPPPQESARPTEQGKPSDVELFLDSQKLNPMQRGKAKSVLDAQAGRRSGGKIYQGKRSDVINEMLADGYVPKSREVKAVKDLTGTQSNRMDNREQADFAKRQAAAGTKTEYTLEKGDGDSIFTVTKQEHDFAKYLQDSKPKEQPSTEHIGMGAAVPSEFSRGQGSPTAMKYKLIDQERQQRGLEPLAKPIGVSDQAVMDKAMAEVDRDPSLPDKLVSELNIKPRSIDAWERMILLLHKIDLRHEYEKSANEAAQAYDDSKEYPDRKADMVAANLRTADLSDQLTKLEIASRVSGSEQGRGLRALRIMANEDYSLASLETQRRAAKGGEPLTDSERADLKKVADDYKKANDELQSHLDKSRASEIEANQRLDEALRQPKPEPIAPHIRALAEKIISASEGLANSARERIKARRAQGRLMTGLDPTDLADHAIVGTDYLLHGVRDFAEWSKSMASEFGDYVKPHLQQIFDASIKGENAKLPKSPEQKTSIKKAVKNMTVGERQNRIEASIKKKFAAGDKDAITSDVQRLARALVEGGIKDREALINAVHGVLKNIDPSITRRDAMDAISGYGDFKQLSKDEVSVRLRGMKGEMQQIAKLQDMAKGVPPSKTGIERRTPTDEERKLIRAVNESKIKFQVPITDPATQLKSALDTRKIQLQRQIEAMQEKMTSGDFSKPPRREIVLDRRAQELQAEKERIAKKFKRQQADYQKAAAKNSSKFLDFISNLRRFSVLSGVNVVGKLAAYSATKLPTIGATEAIGGALGKIPKVSDVLSKAPSEGGFSAKAISNSIAKGLTQGFVDAYKTATKGQSDLRAAYSNRVESGREWYNFFQTIHEIVKSPLRRTAFELSLAKRMDYAQRHGADITDPMTQLALSKDAYLDSDRALLLENNRLAGGIRGLFKQLEAKDKKTGTVPLHGKIAATAGRVELPILNVPLNYVKQTLTAAFGLVSGSVKLRAAFKNGIENLKPEEADAIARHLKYGTIGGAMLLYGFIDGYKNGANGTFGGFYQPGEKRKDNQAGVAGMRVEGHNVPGLLLHNPVLAVAQMGHTIGAIMASKLNKKTDQTHSLPVAAAAGLMGLLNQSPLGNVVEGASQLSDPRSAEWAMGEHVKGLVDPQLSQEIAQWMDKNAQGKVIKRDPKTITQHVETGIPGLRKNVPMKSKQ